MNLKTEYNSFQNFAEDVKSLGVAKDNQFAVTITVPSQMAFNKKGYLIAEDAFMVYANTVSIPPRNIVTAPYRIERAFYEMPYGISFEPVSITFYMDKNMALREFFVDWHDLIYKKDNGQAFYADFVTDMSIHSLDKALVPGSWTYRTNLVNAYPKSVSEVSYSSAGNGQVIQFTVQFVYEDLVEEKNENVQYRASTEFDNGLGGASEPLQVPTLSTLLKSPSQTTQSYIPGSFASEMLEKYPPASSSYEGSTVSEATAVPTVWDKLGDAAKLYEEASIRARSSLPAPDPFSLNN